MFNSENGAKIKELPPHGSEVTKLLECPEAKILVSCSIDNVVHILSDEEEYDGRELLRKIIIKEDVIKSVNFHSLNQHIILGT